MKFLNVLPPLVYVTVSPSLKLWFDACIVSFVTLVFDLALNEWLAGSKSKELFAKAFALVEAKLIVLLSCLIAKYSFQSMRPV